MIIYDLFVFLTCFDFRLYLLLTMSSLVTLCFPISFAIIMVSFHALCKGDVKFTCHEIGPLSFVHCNLGNKVFD